PQNILIGPDDKPKLTDFGLARILDESMSGETGRILGTILYMSPEQTDADDKSIDRRSDVFALGIVLYELLALQRPFDGDTHSQVLEKIRTFEPQRLDKLRSRLPLDLALIVGKALEKKPQDRYQTMDEFADDIQRHLDNFPVQAKAPGAMRRARKWAARNPTPTAAGAVGLIALVALSGMLSKYLDKNEALTEQTETVKLRTEDLRKRNMELEESKEVVQEERDRLEAVVFFNRSIFEGLEQESFGARLRLEIERQLTDRLAKQMASEAEISTSLEILQETLAPVNFTEIGTFAISAEVLDPAKARALNDFNNDPRIKADILSAVAFAYERLGYSENSHALRTTSLGLLRESLGDDHKLTIVALNRMFLALAYPATADLARPYAEEALERSMRVLGPNHEVTLQSVHSMGDLLRIEDRFDEAEDVLKKAAKIRSDAIGPESEAALDSSESLALVYYYQGRHVEAKEILESVLEARRRIDGSKSHAALSSMEKLAMVQVSLLEIDAALPLQEEALAGMRELLGNDHPNTRSALLVMAQIRTFTLEFDKARMLRFEALDSFRRSMGSENRVTLDLISGLAFIERSWLEFDASIKLYREAVTGFTRALGASHPRTLDERNQLGQTMLLVKRPADARHVFEEAYKLASENHGNQSEPHAKAARSLTMCYEQLLKLGPDPQISAALVKLQESK
ncbi:MAG: tetratricopeptide (TPR) repeat protein, partial [Planctomycetota bacterium]